MWLQCVQRVYFCLDAAVTISNIWRLTDELQQGCEQDTLYIHTHFHVYVWPKWAQSQSFHLSSTIEGSTLNKGKLNLAYVQGQEEKGRQGKDTLYDEDEVLLCIVWFYYIRILVIV